MRVKVDRESNIWLNPWRPELRCQGEPGPSEYSLLDRTFSLYCVSKKLNDLREPV